MEVDQTRASERAAGMGRLSADWGKFKSHTIFGPGVGHLLV